MTLSAHLLLTYIRLRHARAFIYSFIQPLDCVCSFIHLHNPYCHYTAHSFIHPWYYLFPHYTVMILLIRAIIHSYVHYTAHSFKQPPYCSFILSTILNYFPNVSIKLLIHSTNQFCHGFIFHIYCSLIQTTICQLLVFIKKNIYKTIQQKFSTNFCFL